MRLSGRKVSRFTRAWSPAQRIVVLTLVSLQVSAFIAQLIIGGSNEAFVLEYLGLSDRGISQAYAWQFITAPLLHNDIWHFLADVLVLYLAGRDVEAIIGQRKFLFLYLFGAFAGELGHLFLMPPDTVLFAASGGTAAVLAAYATMLPELETPVLLLFMVPLRLKMRTIGQLAVIGAVVLLIFDRHGSVGHSAFIGGALAGWLYAHLLGFGSVFLLQRMVLQRRREKERLRSMSAEQFLGEQIDPLLEKITQHGLRSLSRRERRLLDQAREKIVAHDES